MPHNKFIQEIVMFMLLVVKGKLHDIRGLQHLTIRADWMGNYISCNYNYCLLCFNHKLSEERRTTEYFCETWKKKPFFMLEIT